MKSFLRIRAWLFLFVSCFFTVMIVLSCTQEGQESGTSTTTGSGTRDRNDEPEEDDDDKPLLTCEFSSCSGSDCCTEDDEKCEEWCSKDKYLSLSGDEEDKCLGVGKEPGLKKETVERLNEIFTGKFKRNKINRKNLDNLKDRDDIELICAAVKELGTDILNNHIEDYKEKHAKFFLSWLAREKVALEIFENAEDDDGIEMLKDLLKKAGNSSSDNESEQILIGLTKKIENLDDKDEKLPILALADEHNNERLIEYFHETFIADDDEAICEEDKSNNLPEPVSGSGKYSNVAVAEDNKEQACVLAVYCKIADDGIIAEDRDDFRKAMADATEYSLDFIETDIEDGGLDPGENTNNAIHDLTDDDEEEWSNNACENLKHYWDNDGLDLGL